MLNLNIRILAFAALSFLFAPPIILGQNVRSLNNSGVDSYKKQQFVDAEVNFKKGLEKSRESYELNYNLGDAYYKQQRYDEAINSFQNSLTHTEDGILKSNAFYNIGNSLLKSQKIKESVEAYKNSLKLNPNDKDTKYNLSYALSLLKQQQDQQQQNKNQNDKNQDKQDKKDQNKDDQQDQNKNDQKDKILYIDLYKLIRRLIQQKKLSPCLLPQIPPKVFRHCAPASFVLQDKVQAPYLGCLCRSRFWRG